MSERPQSPAVATFDAMPTHEASAILETACGSSAWVSGMVARRPFGTLHRLLLVADELWWSLGPDAWREAFDHHPRIGERDVAVAQGERAQAWSAQEQSGVSSAASDVREALARANAEYERRFGHIYLVCATGKTADDMLALLRQRMANDPDTELRVAAGEQAKITRLRLRRVFETDPSSSSPA